LKEGGGHGLRTAAGGNHQNKPKQNKDLEFGGKGYLRQNKILSLNCEQFVLQGMRKDSSRGKVVAAFERGSCTDQDFGGVVFWKKAVHRGKRKSAVDEEQRRGGTIDRNQALPNRNIRSGRGWAKKFLD